MEYLLCVLSNLLCHNGIDLYLGTYGTLDATIR